MTEISDLIPVKMAENSVIVPTFLTGKLKDAVLPPYQELTGDNSNFQFVDINKEIARGSNVFITGGLNYVLKDSKFRAAVPTDDIYKTILPLIRETLCTIFNALDIGEKKPSYEKNESLWREIVELAEEKQKSVRFPFRVQGFYCIPDKAEKNCGIKIVPAKNFRIIQDERLNLLSGTRFNTLDTNGMINPDEEGNFTWHGLEDSVSEVYLGWGGNLAHLEGDLAKSLDIYRVVLVGSE